MIKLKIRMMVSSGLNKRCDQGGTHEMCSQKMKPLQIFTSWGKFIRNY